MQLVVLLCFLWLNISQEDKNRPTETNFFQKSLVEHFVPEITIKTVSDCIENVLYRFDRTLQKCIQIINSQVKE